MSTKIKKEKDNDSSIQPPLPNTNTIPTTLPINPTTYKIPPSPSSLTPNYNNRNSTTTTTTTASNNSTPTLPSHYNANPPTKRPLETTSTTILNNDIKKLKKIPGPLSIAEEDFIANAFRNVPDTHLSSELRRMKRKFIVRKQQRFCALENFNLDTRVTDILNSFKKKNQRVQLYYEKEEIPPFPKYPNSNKLNKIVINNSNNNISNISNISINNSNNNIVTNNSINNNNNITNNSNAINNNIVSTVTNSISSSSSSINTAKSLKEIEKEKLEEEREKKRKERKEKKEQEKLEKERLEKEREEHGREERERKRKERREKKEKEKLEKENLERMEKEKQEQERLQRENEALLEKQRLEKERIEKEESLEKQRLEKERIEREQLLEKQRLEKEKLEKENLERLEKERLEKERKEKDRRDRIRQERIRLEKLKQEKLQKEKEILDKLRKEGNPQTALFKFYHWAKSSKHQQQNIQFKKPFQPLSELLYGKRQQLKPYVSPHTTRELKPYIRRDYETCPPKLQQLREIHQFFKINNLAPVQNSPTIISLAECQEIYPIDYKYLTPDLANRTNQFLSDHFWPGINVDDILEYPDFTVCALYRSMIIGCGLMNPDGYIMFISVHPEWQGCGIASFMLYHLTQTMIGKDITLHVSANNTALTLYQKFGFKPEEFISNFYDKYYSDDCGKSKNAFLLRLRR